MAVNPDSLLIFKTREETPEKAQQKKKAAQKTENEPMLPSHEEKEFALGEYGEQKKEQEPPKQKVEIQQKAIQEQPKLKQQVEEQKPKEISKEEIKARQEAFVLYKKKGKPEQVKETSVYEQMEPVKEEAEVGVFSNNEYTYRKGSKKQEAALSREAAKDQNCVWHPWRQAYAVCSYCHRPFCFEDTIEYNKTYYCLQDIDNVSLGYRENIGTKSNTIGIIAGIMLLAAFVMFFYYSNAQIIYVLQYLQKAGIKSFIFNSNASYSFALLDSALLVLAFGVAILNFMQSKKAFYIGILITLTTVVIFTYQYINSATFYLGVVDAIVFLSFAAMLYSRTIVLGEETTTHRAGVESNVLRWPNVGRF